MSGEKLQEIFWSVEELIYIHYQDEHIYEIKEKEIIESLSILYYNNNNNNNDNNVVDFKKNNEILINVVEEENKLKNNFLENLIEEFMDLFIVIKLIKNAKHKECIRHRFIHNIFDYIKDIFSNKCINNIEDIKKEICNYIFMEKKKHQEMEYDNNIFLHTCYIFLYEIKLLLCCYILLNIFVQYNWTGPPLNYDIKDKQIIHDEDIYFKDFIHAIHIKNNTKFLNSSLSFLSLEGEEIYEYCELINSFSLSIIFLGLINNYNNQTDNHIFSEKFQDSFEAKIKEIRSIESIIQKCNNEKLVDALISKIVVAIKFLYHLIKSHDVGEKKGTFLYQLKSLIESTLNHYKNLGSENLQELSQIKNILN
ncbi:hypothetical protein PFLG_03099 [Plasmodium falciparum RAJ116]|uniref:Uncharacterized protein n=1 Tax=Plasmodium falciparum RAJ116 TaxID=580058 RepID=A0A0L0D127_PLAFA|nr:hypothetical protein PFLG_03099 [Plasmodium falciparum RAJ116]